MAGILLQKMNSDTIKNSIQAVVDGLTPLAQKLQVPIEGLWTWAIKHNYALAAEDFLVVVLTITMLHYTIKSIKYAMKCDNDDSFTHDSTGFWILGVLGLVVALAFLIGFGIRSIDRIVAPEWNTTQDIMCMIQNCKN